MRFKEMSTWPKVLFILGCVEIVRSVLTFISGLSNLVSAHVLGEQILEEYIDVSESSLTATEIIQLSAGVLLVFGVLGFLAAVCCIQASKGYWKTTLPIVIFSICCVFYVVEFVAGMLGGLISLGSVINIAISIVGIVSCMKVKRTYATSNPGVESN